MALRFWKRLVYFIPSILWMLVIFYFSSRSTTGIGGNNETDRFLILKSFHVIEYSALAILLFFGYRKYKFTIITAYIYALSDEYHQSFVPGRTSRFRDTLIDLGGICLSLFILNILIKNNKFLEKLFNRLPKKI